MSDFLGNLTAKSFNQATVLQPRLASRFEPLPIAINPPLVDGSIGIPPAAAIETPVWFDNQHSQAELVDVIESHDSVKPKEIENQRINPSDRMPSLPTQQQLEPQTIETNLDTSINSTIDNSIDTKTTNQQPRAVESITPILNLQIPKPAIPTSDDRANRPVPIPVQSVNLDLDSRTEPARSVSSQPPASPNPPVAAPATTSVSIPVQILKINQISGVQSIAPAAPIADSTPDPTTDSPSTPTDRPSTPISITPLLNPIATQPTLSPHKVSLPPTTPFPPHPLLPTPVRLSAHGEAHSPTHPPIHSSPPPTIQVTIGRIEVRATPPAPAPVPRTRSTPAVMGLNDYLRQRAKGDGR